MSFNFNNVSDDMSDIGGGGQYLDPGVHEVIVDSIKSKMTTTRNNEQIPTIELHLRKVDSNPGDTTRFNLLMGDQPIAALQDKTGTEITMTKIKHIATKMVRNDDLARVSGSTIDEFAQGLHTLLVGKQFRVKLSGREYLNKDKEVKTAADLPLGKFAEATQPGAEYPVVPAENTELKFDPNKDIRKLKPGQMPQQNTSTAPADDFEAPGAPAQNQSGNTDSTDDVF